MQPEVFEEKLKHLFEDALELKEHCVDIESFRIEAGLCYVLDILTDVLRLFREEFLV